LLQQTSPSASIMAISSDKAFKMDWKNSVVTYFALKRFCAILEKALHANQPATVKPWLFPR
jgi:hypothetical protein